MRKTAMFLAALGLGLLLGACGGETAPTATPTPAAETTPAPAAAEFALPYFGTSSLHPVTGESKTNLALVPLVYQGLFEVDNRFEATPVLAETWTVSEDGLVWTFTLKQAVFSDGSPLTAREAAQSLELARSSELYRERLADLKEAAEVEGKLVLTLRRARGNLPVLLDVPVFKEGEGELPPLGTGRYAFAGEGEQLHLIRVNGGEQLPERIALSPVVGADELIYAFDTGEVSLVSADLTGTDVLGFSGGYELWDYPTTDLVYLGFRTDRGACQDPVLRRAIALALDRESVVTALYAGHAQASVLPVSPVSGLYDRAVAAELAYSPQRAAQVLEEGGYILRDGVRCKGRTAISLTLVVNTDNSFRLSTAEFLAEELEKLGISVAVERLSWQDYTARLEKGDFDLYLAETVLTADFDPGPLAESDGGLNYGRWSDRETDLLLAAFRAAGGETRSDAARELYRNWVEQVPAAPICWKKQSVLTRWGQVSGLTPTRADPFAGDGWQVH